MKFAQADTASAAFNIRQRRCERPKPPAHCVRPVSSPLLQSPLRVFVSYSRSKRRDLQPTRHREQSGVAGSDSRIEVDLFGCGQLTASAIPVHELATGREAGA